MSKRMKFALLIWSGPGVSTMKKAKMSTEKAFVKQVFLVCYFHYNYIIFFVPYTKNVSAKQTYGSFFDPHDPLKTRLQIY
jgi:hypothetical protein